MYLGVNPLRRFLVYIIDIGLIAILATSITIGILYAIRFDFARFNQLSQNISNSYVNIMMGRYTDTIYNDLNEYFQLFVFREGIRLAITFGLYILYLVVFQYFFKGQTLGRVATGVKVVYDDDPESKITIGRLILRELVGSFLFYNLISIIGFISMIFAIASGKSLVDRISRTSMVFIQKIPVNEEINNEFYNQRFEQNENQYTENEFDKNDYIDAEVKDVDNNENNNSSNNSDDDDEYRVI